MVSDILHVTAASLINIYIYTYKDAKIIYDKHRMCGACRMIRITFEYNCPDVFQNVL